MYKQKCRAAMDTSSFMKIFNKFSTCLIFQYEWLLLLLTTLSKDWNNLTVCSTELGITNTINENKTCLSFLLYTICLILQQDLDIFRISLSDWTEASGDTQFCLFHKCVWLKQLAIYSEYHHALYWPYLLLFQNDNINNFFRS